MIFNHFSGVIPRYVDDVDGDEESRLKNTEAYEKIVSLFVEFAENLPEGSYQINPVLLGRVIRRINRRLTQFEVFHDYDRGTPSEIKRAAMCAFWIIKLKPFSILVKTSNNVEVASEYLFVSLNEQFARVLIFSAIQNALNKNSPETEYKFDEDLQEIIDYAFRHWDFSKESFLFIAEALYFQLKSMKMK